MRLGVGVDYRSRRKNADRMTDFIAPSVTLNDTLALDAGRCFCGAVRFLPAVFRPFAADAFFAILLNLCHAVQWRVPRCAEARVSEGIAAR